MKYFNGFSLTGEESFFKEQLIETTYVVAGFSFGAQKAFEYAYHSDKRIDRLILLSPAFFQNHKKSFIKTQLRYFKANEKSYTEQFLKNVTYPSNVVIDDFLTTGSYEELEALLTYRWDVEKFKELLKKGIKVEVFMGEKDKIVDVSKSFKFFSELSNVYFIKDVGHLLQK